MSGPFQSVHAEDTVTCGANTVFDDSTQQCVCSSDQPRDPNEIYIAAIFDTTTYDWGPDLVNVTVDLINQGWWDALSGPGEFLRYELANAKCDATTAVRAYWELRTQNGNKPMDGILACRCSGASISVARTSGLEGVPQISAASNDATLSNEEEFPYFSRVVSPNNENGEVGAMVAMLRHFGWERVTILNTDTDFAKGFATELRKLWAGAHQDDSGDWFGVVAYSNTIRLNQDDTVNVDSALQVLEGIPVDDPADNSRIIVLVAHGEHSFQFIEQATLHNFQPDTVWVGTSSFVAGYASETTYDWIPPIPGYLAVGPFQNRDGNYDAFLESLNLFEKENGKPVTSELTGFASETVDAMIAMTKAISHTPPQQRGNGTAVVQKLRQLDFPGVSGRVQFTTNGDRKDPKFSIFNAKAGPREGTFAWEDVGTVRNKVGTVQLEGGVQSICFGPECGLSNAVSDTYPIPPISNELETWVWIVFAGLLVLILVIFYMYLRSRRKKRMYKAGLEAFRESVVGMRAAECNYIPKVVANDIENALDLKGTVAVPPMEKPEVVQWCWQETECMMQNQDPNVIYGDPSQCWIRYDHDSNDMLEEAYQAGKKKCSPRSGYTVTFSNMIQVKNATGFQRNVLRVLEKSDTDSDCTDNEPKVINLDDLQTGGELPEELRGEPQMVLVEGDIVQISKYSQCSEYAFGSKLHHADEATARHLVAVATGSTAGIVNDEPTVFSDSGWFPLRNTRMPTTEDLEALQLNLGDTGALNPPDHWDDVVDPTVVELHEVKRGEPEYDSVIREFMSTLKRPQFDKNVKVIKVERIQNLANYQSYVVKRQTICYRETNGNTDEDVQRKALERFEKSWLWHGSNAEVLDKILQQGFNRSFCGKNATMYGKGVYFARDAAYSAYPTYAVPDDKGRQYILACRVVIGEYCKGRHDAVTPDIRDSASQSLYDSTVGLLGRDTMSNPSIYVTYHDAQAYPDYLITFKTS